MIFDHLNKKKVDLGLKLKSRLKDKDTHLEQIEVDYLVRVDKDLYMANCSYTIDEQEYDVSLLFPTPFIVHLVENLMLLDADFSKNLKKSCFKKFKGYEEIAFPDRKFLVMNVIAGLDLENESEYEDFLPFIVSGIEGFSVNTY